MRYHVEAVGTYGYSLRGERCGERGAHVHRRKGGFASLLLL